MANTLLTIDMITKEALRLAHEKATFLGTINRQFDDSFGASSGKIGEFQTARGEAFPNRNAMTASGTARLLALLNHDHIVRVHGLTRNGRDFDALAQALAQRRQVCRADGRADPGRFRQEDGRSVAFGDG